MSCVGGPLSGIIGKRVGPWTLNENSVQPIEELVEAGAVEGLKMEYTKQDGANVWHYLSAWPSDDGANEWLQGGVEYWSKEQGLKITEEGPVENPESGEQYGTFTLLEGTIQGQPRQYILWTNGCVVGEVMGLESNAEDFFNVPPPY